MIDKDFFNRFEDNAEISYANENGFAISWSVKGRGFGEYAFFKKDDKWMIDNECDSRDNIKKVLEILVDSLLLTDDPETTAKEE